VRVNAFASSVLNFKQITDDRNLGAEAEAESFHYQNHSPSTLATFLEIRRVEI
jgi:hypothetical protein